MRTRTVHYVLGMFSRIDWMRTLLGTVFGILVISLPLTAPVQAQKGPTKKAKGPATKRTAKASPAQIAYSDAANIQNNSEFGLAIVEWQKFLKKYPTDDLAPQARHYLGVCLLQQGNFADAAAAFDQVVRKHPDFEFVDESHLNLGWCQYSAAIGGQGDQFPVAEKTLTGFLKVRKESELRDQALFYLGESLYLQGKRDAAIPIYKELVDEHSDSKLRPDALYAFGVSQQELGDSAAAVKTFDAFLTDFPRHELNTEITMRKAESLIRLENYAAAEPLFAKVSQVKDFPDYNHALFRRAFCVLKQGRNGEAANLYSQVSTQVSEPRFVASAQVSAGRAYYQAGKTDEAQKWFAKAADQPTTVFEATHWLCRIAIKGREFDRAQRLAEAALANAQGHVYEPTLQLDLADAIYEKTNGKEQALATYQRIASEHPKADVAPQALYNAAYAAMELEKYDVAIQNASEFGQRYGGVTLHRLLPDVRYVRAESHLLSGKHADAEQLYASLVEDFPNHQQSGLWGLRYAAALQVQDKHKETLSKVAEQIHSIKDPQLVAEAHYLAGYSHASLGDQQKAIDSYQASLASSTNWRRADDAVLQLSQALTAQGKTSEAKNVFARYKTSVEQSDRPDAVRYQLAETNYESKNYQQAYNEYEGLLKQWPGSEFAASALFGKAWSQFKLGRPADAVPTFTQLIEGYDGHVLMPRAYRARAMCRQLAGDAKGGIQDVKAYLATNPPEADQAEAFYVRGLCEVALKDNTAAKETLEMVLGKFADYNRRDRVLYELGWLQKNAKQSEQSIAHFENLVEEFPDSRLSAEAHYHLAEYAYTAKQYPAAIEAYTSALAATPSADIGERALYKRGWCAYQQKSHETALESFREQVQMYPDGKLHTDARFMVGECYYNLKDYEQVITSIKELDFAKLPEQSRVLAQLHAGQSAVQLKQWQTAVELLRPVVAENQTSPLVGKASFELARAYEGVKRTDEAEKLYKQVAEQSRNSVGARSQFMLGELYFARKDLEPALQEFQRLMFGFGGTKAPASIKTWQAKAGLEAGRVTAIMAGKAKEKAKRTELMQRAKKYFEFVVDQHSDSNEATAAASQLKRLGV